MYIDTKSLGAWARKFVLYLYIHIKYLGTYIHICIYINNNTSCLSE